MGETDSQHFRTSVANPSRRQTPVGAGARHLQSDAPGTNPVGWVADSQDVYLVIVTSICEAGCGRGLFAHTLRTV